MAKKYLNNSAFEKDFIRNYIQEINRKIDKDPRKEFEECAELLLKNPVEELDGAIKAITTKWEADFSNELFI